MSGLSRAEKIVESARSKGKFRFCELPGHSAFINVSAPCDGYEHFTPWVNLIRCPVVRMLSE